MGGGFQSKYGMIGFFYITSYIQQGVYYRFIENSSITKENYTIGPKINIYMRPEFSAHLVSIIHTYITM